MYVATLILLFLFLDAGVGELCNEIINVSYANNVSFRQLIKFFFVFFFLSIVIDLRNMCGFCKYRCKWKLCEWILLYVTEMHLI